MTNIKMLVVGVSAVVGLTCLVAVAGTGLKVFAPHPAAVVMAPAPTSQSTPMRDPLEIEAMRARTYPASTLTVTEDLGEQGGYHESISSYVSDGLTEYALVSTPDGPRPEGGWPTIILAHGYEVPTLYRTDGSYGSIISALAQAGYLVVKPDYRGHGSSQGTAAGGHYSPAYAYDILNLISTLKQYPDANPARLGLLGHSMGGHEALRTIVVSKDIKATVIMSGVVGSLADLIYRWPRTPIPRDQPTVAAQGAKGALLAKYGAPETNPVFWDSASAINYVADIAGPVQIQHSVGDSSVPKLFADHLDGALTAAGKPHEYYTYPGDDHQFTANRSLFLMRMLAFYGANL